jgi:hypothetical protein
MLPKLKLNQISIKLVKYIEINVHIKRESECSQTNRQNK